MTNRSARVITPEETTLYSIQCAECGNVSVDYEHYEGSDPLEEISSLTTVTTVDDPDTIRFICWDCEDSIFADSNSPESGYRWVCIPTGDYKFYEQQWN